MLLHRTIGEGLGILVKLSHGMADLVSYGNVVRDIEQVQFFFFFSLCFYMYVSVLMKHIIFVLLILALIDVV